MGKLVQQAEAMPRGLENPWVHVKYSCDGHDHVLSGCTREPGEPLGEYIEDVANELAEAVLRCNPSRHNGHGITHGMGHAEKAYAAAVYQLLSRDYWQEFVDLNRKIEHFRLWGNKHPADLVFQPNPENPSDWLMMVKHPITGLPSAYNIPNLLELPPPDPKKYHRGKWNFYRKGK